MEENKNKDFRENLPIKELRNVVSELMDKHLKEIIEGKRKWGDLDGLPPSLREIFKLKDIIYGEVKKIADPYNEKKSEIEMKISAQLSDYSFMMLLTELPNHVRVVTYSVPGGRPVYSFGSYHKRKRSVRKGKIPKYLYRKLWEYLESNNVWELNNEPMKFYDGAFHCIFDGTFYHVNLLKENKKHIFSVTSPHSDKGLVAYKKIVDRIYRLSFFAFSNVKTIQPLLDKISKKELEKI